MNRTVLEQYTRGRDAALAALARRLPRRLAYWSLIDSGVRAIHSNEEVPAVAFTTVLQRAGAAL